MTNKPHIRRVRLLNYPVYVWGVFQTRTSRRPVALSHRLWYIVAVATRLFRKQAK